METRNVTSKEYFSSLTILHAALLFGQISIALIIFFLIKDGHFKLSLDTSDPLQLITPFIIMSGLIGSFIFFNGRIREARDKADLKEKLKDYKSALLIRYALIEGPILFSLITYITSLNYLFIVIACPMIVLFLFLRPTKEKTIYDLELSPSDASYIENPEAIVGSVVIL